MLTARSVKHLTRGVLFTFSRLLGREVKVESRLKSVELELTWRKEVPWRWSGLKRESLLSWLSWLLEARLLNTGLVTSEQTSLLVRSIKGVDERINSSTVSTGRDTVHKVVAIVGSKVGSISVELEVTVSRVVRVDEWVEVRINWCINIVIVNWLCNRSRLTNRGSNLDGSSRCRGLGNKSSRSLASSSGGNMSSF